MFAFAFLIIAMTMDKVLVVRADFFDGLALPPLAQHPFADVVPGNPEVAFIKATQCLHPKVLTRVLNSYALSIPGQENKPLHWFAQNFGLIYFLIS